MSRNSERREVDDRPTTVHQLVEESFIYHCEVGKRLMPASRVATVVRALGIPITQNQINDLVICGNPKRLTELSDVSRLVDQLLVEDVVSARDADMKFAFDTLSENGTVSVGMLRGLLQQTRGRLSDEELESAFSSIDSDQLTWDQFLSVVSVASPVLAA